MRSQNEVVKAYHENWKKKAADTGRLAFQMRAVKTLHNLFKDVLRVPFQGKILDLGCGDGSMVTALNEYGGLQARGIDISHGVNFETDALPFTDREFDLILMYSVIEHLYDPGNILAEVKRILRPGGKLIVITPNFDLGNLLVCCRTFYDDPTHVHPYNPKSLEHVMRACGLRRAFIGLWTVMKPSSIWKWSPGWQFFLGALLPFPGNHPWAPSFLKGQSKTILAVFSNEEHAR